MQDRMTHQTTMVLHRPYIRQHLFRGWFQGVDRSRLPLDSVQTASIGWVIPAGGVWQMQGDIPRVACLVADRWYQASRVVRDTTGPAMKIDVLSQGTTQSGM